MRHSRPIQIYGKALQRPPKVDGRPAPELRKRVGQTTVGVHHECGWLGGRRFRFLNEEREIVTWNDPGTPKLWLYSLHYQHGVTSELMEWWRAENPPAGGNGWEPYPLSQRIGSWIRWVTDGGELSGPLRQSLATQVRYLRGEIEWHLQGNHLLVNGKALLQAGLLFEGTPESPRVSQLPCPGREGAVPVPRLVLNGAEAEQWRRQGADIVQAALHDQILPDGGHVERSPMYQALLLEDVLELVNTHRAFGAESTALEKVAGRMWGWLEQMTHADGEIAFFNDATTGVAPTLCALAGFAQRLGIEKERRPLAESGFVRLEAEGILALVDVGSVGPSYQPAHAHAGTLGLEVSSGKRRLIVNSGISTYEKNSQRQWERGTAAHSTVLVDGLDSSEVCDQFRVARRAKVVERSTDGRNWVTAAHDGYLRVGVKHRRKVSVLPGTVLVMDDLAGRGRHRVEVLFHLGPGQNGQVVELDARLRREERKGEYHRQFGLSEEIVTVAGVWEGILPVEFECAVRSQDPAAD
ncbi:MAG TPA: alginate lyase family protein [Paludibaculum sp.]